MFKTIILVSDCVEKEMCPLTLIWFLNSERVQIYRHKNEKGLFSVKINEAYSRDNENFKAN